MILNQLVILIYLYSLIDIDEMIRMPKRKFVGHQYFEIVNGEHGFGKCNIEGCTYVYVPAKNSPVHSKPLLDHFKRKHPEMYSKCSELELKKSKLKTTSSKITDIAAHFPAIIEAISETYTIKYNISRRKLQRLAVDAVTKDGLPFSVFEKPSLQKLLQPIVDKTGVNLNRRALRNLTLDAAKKYLSGMKEKLKGCLVCLKVDLCSRKGRHFIGINVQVIHEGMLDIFTLTVKEMFVSSTAEEIKTMILNALSTVGVDLNQIYSITTDNGANVIKSCKLLSEVSRAELGACTSGETASAAIQITDSREGEDTDSDEEDDNQGIPEGRNSGSSGNNDTSTAVVEILIDDAVNGIVTEQSISEQQCSFGIASVKCAAHTLQLAVNDVVKKRQFNETIEAARKIVKKTRNHNLRLVFRKHQQSLPVLDCETRWGSTYVMLDSLCKNKGFLSELALTNEALLLTDDQWLVIEGIVAGLKQVYVLSKVLQTKSLTAGYFLASWTKTKLVLKSFTNSPISAYLAQAMTVRETTLVHNPAFLASVFLDLRFKSLLTGEQEASAKAHLLLVSQKLEQIVHATHDVQVLDQSRSPAACISDSGSNVDDDQLGDKMLETLLKSKDGTNKGDRSTPTGICEALDKIASASRIPQDVEIRSWWMKHGPKELIFVAFAVLALPVSQVSVERTFSGLRYILSERRMCLNDVSIDAVMILRCNT